ncbi:MAG: calcium/sodium antiporter [Anaerolineae bacterium]|nr:calcium/sodium antiporter [Thermoflexales bacterium]MDW8406635.1 calcium/sodium antiporter [Anaerolineae bacterium]
MDWTTLFLFVLGLVGLIAGAEALVRGASRLAAAIGISPLVIGLTVVAFGTSSPELAVSVFSALAGQPDIAMGNVVGSNIFNVLLILGLSAVVAPLIVSQQLVRLDVPLMIAVSVLTFLFALDESVSRLEGVILFGGLIAYTTFLIIQSRKETNAAVREEYEYEFRPPAGGLRGIALNLVFVVVGLVMLVIGSRWLVDGAVVVARALGVDEVVIGLTIIAGGTSLPEVATSVMASVRGERDIAVGNVVGSNIFNLLSVLGLTAIVAPNGVSVEPALLAFDMPVMLVVAFACLPIFFTGYTIARWEGLVFLSYYVAYTLYLIFDATEHALLPMYSSAMLFFALPLTALTLAVTVLRHLRTLRRA